MRILIKNAFIVTQNKKREYISEGFIIIKNDKFEKISKGNPSGRISVVYLTPPSMEELERRLLKDSRDENGSRIREAREELEDFYRGKYAGLYDLCLTTQSGGEDIITQSIYEFYLKSLQ